MEEKEKEKQAFKILGDLPVELFDEVLRHVKYNPDRVDYGKQNSNSPLRNSEKTARKVKDNAPPCRGKRLCMACLDPNLKHISESDEYDAMMIFDFNSFPRYTNRHELHRLERIAWKNFLSMKFGMYGFENNKF